MAHAMFYTHQTSCVGADVCVCNRTHQMESDVEKLAAQSLHLPATFWPLSNLNNPMRHGHKVPGINQEVLLSLVNAVKAHLEKSYFTRTNFKPVKNVLGNITEICVKYSDYLTKSKHIQVEY